MILKVFWMIVMGDYNMQSISIVIPVYNESEAIKGVLINLKYFLDTKDDIKYEIICINDCSTDNSLEILNQIDFIKVVSHKVNRGYGAALKSGINNAKNEIILIMDSDGQHKVEDIPKLLEPLRDGYDMSVGSRNVTNTKKSRVLGKVVIHQLANYLMQSKIPDINSGFRCFYKDEAKKYLHLCSERFSFTTSITMAYLQEHKDIKYTPIEVYNRTTGESQVNYKSGLRTMLKIIQIVMVFNPLRVLIPMVIFFLSLTGLSLGFDIYRMNLADTTVLLSITTVLVFIFSLIADQLSTLRREFWVK
jgi:glycosyltransferase involved in cell wall biosynthesis